VDNAIRNLGGGVQVTVGCIMASIRVALRHRAWAFSRPPAAKKLQLRERH
jgi:hypothetical protein